MKTFPDFKKMNFKNISEIKLLTKENQALKKEVSRVTSVGQQIEEDRTRMQNDYHNYVNILLRKMEEMKALQKSVAKHFETTNNEA